MSVVMIAISTMRVNRSLLSTPMARPMLATMISVEPRAFMPMASARLSRGPSRPSRPPP